MKTSVIFPPLIVQFQDCRAGDAGMEEEELEVRRLMSAKASTGMRERDGEWLRQRG
jgi:hypothetical protein